MERGRLYPRGRFCFRSTILFLFAAAWALVPSPARAADFAFGFEGCPERILGNPGEVKTFDVYLTLSTSNNEMTDGAQGWSMSLKSEGGAGEIAAITLKGIIVRVVCDEDPVLGCPLDLCPLGEFCGMAEICRGEEVWAVTAVVLGSAKNRALLPNGTQRVARITVQVTIPEECASLTLRYIDGARCSTSQPISNVITWMGASYEPALGSAAISLCPANFRRGDSNGDGKVDISDPIDILEYLFLKGDAPGCFRAADGNDDSKVDIADPVLLLMDLFLSETGGLIPPPGPKECGLDPGPEPEVLTCDSYPACV